ncbi:ROK family protein [Rhodococcus rhodnii]|uniref:Glucokinase n=2 Tax=Rhodococcus rhodnii TaxID=38312 RepID=R7WVG8_9NOCA|nr:ROK family protein [Rhodococcus rhodnii]EOM78154.1 glucokinase [Rhodococcus rhodnii LMG 5362]TXG91417.1 ROK family protein [Rhodococcus rhodnii]
MGFVANRRHGRPGGQAVGIDVGGTSIRAAVVDRFGTVLDTVRAPTPSSEQALDDALVRAVRDLQSRHDIAAVGLAVAGFLTADRSRVRFAPHLPWRDAPVGARLSERVGVPVVVEHDANAAGHAEYRYGAASGARGVVLLAIGTGIGAAYLRDGELFRGTYGIAPELGHIQVVPGGRACPCGKRGCWERYCSGTALVDTAIDMLAADPSTSVLAHDVAVDPGSLTGRRIAAAAQDGDALAVAVIDDFADWLAVGLAVVVDVFDPELVVIGGGAGASGPLFLDRARERWAELSTGGSFRPRARIRSSQLGEAAGMIGAADIARATIAR